MTSWNVLIWFVLLKSKVPLLETFYCSLYCEPNCVMAMYHPSQAVRNVSISIIDVLREINTGSKNLWAVGCHISMGSKSWIIKWLIGLYTNCILVTHKQSNEQSSLLLKLLQVWPSRKGKLPTLGQCWKVGALYQFGDEKWFNPGLITKYTYLFPDKNLVMIHSYMSKLVYYSVLKI